MKNKDLLRKLQNSYEIWLLVIGLLSFAFFLFLRFSKVDCEHWSTLFCNVGGILIPAAIYRIIEKHINKLDKQSDKQYVTSEYLRQSRIDKCIDKHIACIGERPLEFVNIGSFDDVIKIPKYTFGELVSKEEYLGKTVLIIGTTLEFLQKSDKTNENFIALKDGCIKGIHFKLVVTDPYSIYMTGDAKKGVSGIEGLIEDFTAMQNTIETDKSQLKGSIELRISPQVDRLHSFSLFNNGSNRIITLDYKLGDKKFCQMFYDIVSKNEDTLSGALAKYCDEQFTDAIPYVKIASGSMKLTIKVFIVMNGKILLNKSAWESKSKENVFEIFPSFENIDYSAKVLSKILQALFNVDTALNDSQLLENSPIQFLKAFQKDECTDTIYLVGEIINNRFDANKLKNEYGFYNTTRANNKDKHKGKKNTSVKTNTKGENVDDFIKDHLDDFQKKIWDYIGTIN